MHKRKRIGIWFALLLSLLLSACGGGGGGNSGSSNWDSMVWDQDDWA